MKRLTIFLAVPLALMLFTAASIPSHAAPPQAQSALTNELNYVVRIEWKDNKAPPRFLQLTTAEGHFQLNTSQPGTVKLGDNELSISITVNGDLKVLDSKQGRLQLFLGRTVPYLTSNSGPGGNSSSTVQQRQEGLTAALIVNFDKPLVIQKDANGEVSVLIKRQEP
jgi:hypothetical protein